jgi:hypothetical protein
VSWGDELPFKMPVPSHDFDEIVDAGAVGVAA